MAETKNYDISKSVRFDSRVLATIGKYLVTEMNYPISTSTDLVRTALDKLHAFIVAAGGEQIVSYADAREWFISQGLGDLFKQGNKLNKAHVKVSAQENELFVSLSNTMSESGDKPAGYDELSTEQQQMVDSLNEATDAALEAVTVARTELTQVEPESRRKDIKGLKDLANLINVNNKVKEDD